jgi:hypothetical protein
MPRFLILLGCVFFQITLQAQTLGGQNTYNFLRFPSSPQLSALGGQNISIQSNDVSLVVQNPALLNESMHTQLATNFNSLYNGVQNYNAVMAYRHPKLKTNFAGSILFFNYGSGTQTDASGNIFGSFRATDYALQISASREYLTRWQYGMSVKYIASNYGLVRSSAIAADIGVLYKDTVNQIQMSLMAQNMGGQIRRYNNNVPEELPFDLVFGISKKLANAPIQFSFTAHHLHQFDLQYNDTLFNQETGSPTLPNNKFTIDKLFQHFVFATQITLGKRVEVSVGYNYLRRSELRINNAANGLVGFSLGVGALFPKLQLRYARSYFQNTTAYNQLGINLPLNQYFGLGKWGEKHGW